MNQNRVCLAILFAASTTVLAQAVFAQGLVTTEGDAARDAAASIERRVEEFLAESAWFNNHEVRLEVDGSLPGTAYRFDVGGSLVPAPKVPVTFMQNGKVVGQRKPTDPQGTFQAPIAPGIYTVFIGDLSDQYGFACAAIRVLPYLNESTGEPAGEPPVKAIADPTAPPAAIVPPAPKRLEMAMIRPGDVAAMRALIARKFINPALSQPANPAWLGPADRNLTTVLSSVPLAERTTAKFAHAQRLFRIDARREIMPYDGPWYYRHEVYLNQNSGLHGHLRTFNRNGELQPVADAELCFVQQGSVIRSVETSDQGAYAVSQISPGVYSVMAANFEGFGCYGVRLDEFAGESVPDGEPAGGKAQAVSFSRRVIAPGDSPDVNTTIATGPDALQFLNSSNNADGLPGAVTNPAGGVAGGGTGGGGLAAMAAAAAAMAALSNSDNSTASSQTPPSP